MSSCYYMFISVNFICLTAHICSYETSMVSCRWKSFYSYNIFFWIHCFTVRIESWLATTYGLSGLLSALTAFFRLCHCLIWFLLPYLGCYGSIWLISSLSQLLFCWPLSLMIFLSGSYAPVLIMEFNFLWPLYMLDFRILIVNFYRGTLFFITDLYDWNLIILLHIHIEFMNSLWAYLVDLYCFFIALWLSLRREGIEQSIAQVFSICRLWGWLTFSSSHVRYWW